MKPPFQKDRKLDLNMLEDWPRKVREYKEAAAQEALILLDPEGTANKEC